MNADKCLRIFALITHKYRNINKSIKYKFSFLLHIFLFKGHFHGSHGGEEIAKSTLLDKNCSTIDGAESRNLLQSNQDRAMVMTELEVVEESLMSTFQN